MKKILLTIATLALTATAAERYMMTMISLYDGYPKYYPYGKIYDSFESCGLEAASRRAHNSNEYITFECYEKDILKILIAGAR